MQIIIILFIVFILFYLQSLIYSKRCFHNLMVDIDLSTKGAFEGDKIYIRETIQNQKWMPLLWLSVKFQVSRHLRFLDQENSRLTDDFYRNDMFSILFYQKITKKLPVLLCKRGYYTIKSIELVTGDLFGFHRLAKQVSSHVYLYVYPKLLPIEDIEVPFQKIMGEILTKRYIIEDPFEFRGIRDYSPYDSLKSVNWSATARTGHLKVNVHDYTSSQEIIIFLNVQKESVWDSEKVIEESIRLAASFAFYYITQGISVRLISNGRDLITREEIHIPGGCSNDHILRIYEALARMDTDIFQDSFSQILQDQLLVQNPESLWLLISHYHEPDLTEKVNQVKSNGYSLQWILPKKNSNPVMLEQQENIFIWEVNDYES